MVGRNERHAAVLPDAAPQGRDRIRGAEQCLAGEGAQTADNKGRDDFELPIEIGATKSDFFGKG